MKKFSLTLYQVDQSVRHLSKTTASLSPHVITSKTTKMRGFPNHRVFPFFLLLRRYHWISRIIPMLRFKNHLLLPRHLLLHHLRPTHRRNHQELCPLDRESQKMVSKKVIQFIINEFKLKSKNKGSLTVWLINFQNIATTSPNVLKLYRYAT